eukprot:Amastigsp_a841147_405.p5 type:complete len:100 gc:universal Amastigsp_a841147_405:941-642(-)
MSSSDAPSDASPTSCENSAKSGSASSGAWPRSSWQTSGSGVYSGRELWRMYCVEWKVRNASPLRKSRAESRPWTGRRRNPDDCSRNRDTSSSCGMRSGP